MKTAVHIEVTFALLSFSFFLSFFLSLFPYLKTALKKRRFYTTMSEAKSQDAVDEFQNWHFIKCIKWWHDPQQATHTAR
jgi:hypothetical protein